MYQWIAITLLAFRLLYYGPQFVFSGYNKGPSGNTFTLVQATTSGTTQASASSMTVTSTGSGHLLVLTSNLSGGGQTISSVSCSTTCGTWVVPTGCKQTGGSGAESCAYILSSTSGATSVSATMSAAESQYWAFYEWSYTPGPAALDVCGNSNPTAGSGSMLGQALTLTGSKDAIVQIANTGGATITAINSGYTIISTFNNTTQQSAYITNGTTGSAPSWSTGASGTQVAGACAFK